MKKLVSMYLLGSLLAFVIPVQAQSPSPTDLWEEIEVDVVVKGVDIEKRELTIETPFGQQVALKVDKRIKRLDEVKVGDKISVEYYRYAAAEFRAPTPEEKKEPIQFIELAEKRPPGIPPGAGDFRLIRAVVTIEALNRITETATVRGPLGRYLTVGVADPRKLEQVRIGDTVLLTYSEALIVTLDPAE